jgi:hypothetical protein
MSKEREVLFETREQVIAYLLSKEAQKPGKRIVWEDGYRPIHTVVSGNHVRRFMPPPTKEERERRHESMWVNKIRETLQAMDEAGGEVKVRPAPQKIEAAFPRTLEALEALSFADKLLLAGWTEVPPDPRDVAIFGKKPDQEDMPSYDELLTELKKSIQAEEPETAGEKFAKFIDDLIALIISLFSPTVEDIVNSDKSAPKPA